MPNTVKFNQGETTSDVIEREFRPEFVTKAVVAMPEAEKHFSNRSNKIDMPKNHGDKLTKIVQFPMIHKDNMVDAALDANTATIVQNEFARVKKDGTGLVVQRYSVENYLAADGSISLEDARTAAKAAATADLQAGEVVKSTAGSILNGQASYALQSGPLVPMPEEGGVINLLTAKDTLVSAKITRHAVGSKYTVLAKDLTSRKGQVARTIKDIARAVGELKEMQVQTSLLATAQTNLMPSTSDATVVSVNQLDGMDTITYETLTAFEQELLKNDVPMDTEMLTGVDLIDTRVVNDAFIAYVNREAIPVLRAMKGPDGELVWIPKAQYGADTKILPGEWGTIGSFRFVVVPNLQVLKGGGSKVGDADTADTVTQAGAFATMKSDGSKYYDVFFMLVVGDDSFSISGYGEESTNAHHITPKADVHHDMHGQVGGVAANWSYGYLPYRPERIRALAFTATRSGKVVAA